MWSTEKFGHATKELEQLRGELELLEQADPISNREAILKTKQELDELLYREEMMWLQRSRILWLKEGDRNTKYFHRKAMWRARKNNIRKLRQDDGTWCTDQNTMKGMAINYFEQLFRKDEHINPYDIVDLLEPAVSAQENESLQ